MHAPPLPLAGIGAPPSWRERLVVLAIAALFILPGLGLREPWPADEPRFALVAQTMANGGDWWFPMRGAEYYADKPPLTFWMMAGLMTLGLPLTIAFLLPSMLAGIGVIGLLHDLAARLHGRRAGLLAAGAGLALFALTFQAHQAQLDATVGFWCMLGVYGLCRHLMLGQGFRWWWLGCVGMGAGIITKGVGFLPLFLLLPWTWAVWRGWSGVASPGRSWWRWALGPVLMLAVISCWLVPMAIQAEGDPAKEAYRSEILFSQTVKRYADAWHHKAWFGYFVVEVIPWLWLPITVLVPFAIAPWWRRFRRGDARIMVPLVTAAIIVLFFSLSRGKRGVYVLPAAPLLILALTPLLPGMCRWVWVRTGAWIVSLVIGVALIAAAALGPFLGSSWERLLNETEGWDPRWAALILGSGAGLAAAWAGRRRGFLALGLTMAMGWLVLGLMIWPGIDNARSSKPFMAQVAAKVPAGESLALIGFPEQFLLHCPIPAATSGVRRRGGWRARELEWAKEWLTAKPGRWALLSDNDSEGSWALPYERHELGERHRREWVLLHHRK